MAKVRSYKCTPPKINAHLHFFSLVTGNLILYSLITRNCSFPAFVIKYRVLIQIQLNKIGSLIKRFCGVVVLNFVDLDFSPSFHILFLQISNCFHWLVARFV